MAGAPLRLAALLIAFSGFSPALADFVQEDRIRADLTGLEALRVHDIAVDRRGRPWVATADGLYREEDGTWRRLLEGGVDRLAAGRDGELYLAIEKRIERWIGSKDAGEPVLTHALGRIDDFAVSTDGTLLVAGPELDPRSVTITARSEPPPARNLAVYDRRGERLELPPRLAELAAFSLACDAAGVFWIGARAGLFRWPPAAEPTRIAASARELLGEVLWGLTAFEDGGVWFGNDLGVTRYDPSGDEWTGLRPDTHGTPLTYVRAIDRDRSGELWIAADIGVARRRGNVWTYFQGPQWLPDDDVTALACLGDDRVLVGTSRGLGVIGRRRTTLKEKAAHFDDLARERHFSRHGFVWAAPLARPGDIESIGECCYSDNDGLWTSSYIASQCLRYAVTRSPEARENARRAMRGLLMLETVTGIRGYPARSYARRDQIGERPELASWYPSPDGVHVFKGDTSSDEIVGHYFAHALYWDHVAGEDEKAILRLRVRELTDHIIEHDYTLVQRADGEPTRWGIWNPERIGEWGHYWYSTGLWALCILSHLEVAHHITGDEKYEREADRLVEKFDYARKTVLQKVTIPGLVNHSDDQMALYSYYPLLLYEKDQSRRRIYLESLERSWRIERPEHSPTWNFVYNLFSENPLDRRQSLRHLEEMPWLLIDWPHDNTRRRDLPLKPLLAAGVESSRALSMQEYGPYTFTSNPYVLKSGGRGRRALSPSIFLLPYWLGRYHGFIGEEE